MNAYFLIFFASCSLWVNMLHGAIGVLSNAPGELRTAVREGSLKKIYQAIANGARVTPEIINEARAILDINKIVNMLDPDKATKLTKKLSRRIQDAQAGGLWSLVLELFNAGAEPATPEEAALINEKINLTKARLEHLQKNLTAAREAIRSGDHEQLSTLIRETPQIKFEHFGPNQETLLIIASNLPDRKRAFKFMQLLLSDKASADSTSLLNALKHHDQKSVDLLIEHNAYLENTRLDTMLHTMLAGDSYALEMLAKIREAREAKKPAPPTPLTPLEIQAELLDDAIRRKDSTAAIQTINQHPQVAKMAYPSFTRVPDEKESSGEERYPIYKAINNDLGDVIDTLLRHGGYVTIRPSPLLFAAELNKKDLVKIIRRSEGFVFDLEERQMLDRKQAASLRLIQAAESELRQEGWKG